LSTLLEAAVRPFGGDPILRRQAANRADFEPKLRASAKIAAWRTRLRLASRALRAGRDSGARQALVGSDATLRLAWGKTVGTSRQLVGLLRAAEVDAPATEPAPGLVPAPSPNPLPPPPPPPIGSEPQPAAASALKPADVMEFEICPRVEQAIGEIAHMVTAATTEEIEAVRDRFSDIPNKIYEAASGQDFGPVAALEFQKGLELVNHVTRTPPDQPADIAARLDSAADRVTSLEGGTGDEPTPTPSFTPAPSPNPLRPPPL
jgi:hypothetical protein